MASGDGGWGEAGRALGLVTSIGMYIAVWLVAGVSLGLLFSHLLGGNALPLVIGFGVGIGAGCYGAYRMIMRLLRRP